MPSQVGDRRCGPPGGRRRSPHSRDRCAAASCRRPSGPPKARPDHKRWIVALEGQAADAATAHRTDDELPLERAEQQHVLEDSTVPSTQVTPGRSRTMTNRRSNPRRSAIARSLRPAATIPRAGQSAAAFIIFPLGPRGTRADFSVAPSPQSTAGARPGSVTVHRPETSRRPP
jgi:hypothetical protein